jgi:putative intracellular protease/amidase
VAKLACKQVTILVEDGFEQVELVEPRKRWIKRGSLKTSLVILSSAERGMTLTRLERGGQLWNSAGSVPPSAGLW